MESETNMLRARLADLSPSAPGKHVASTAIEITLANGVSAPRQMRIHVMPTAIAFQDATLSAESFDIVETINRPAIVNRKRSNATPGNPAGNIEKSLCIRKG
jgi:hypothetical protein